MASRPALETILEPLNPAQRQAAAAGDAPLLIVAGAGTGKTQTLAHRVAVLVARGADPRRILLLTFSRRAAQEMTRRAARLIGARGAGGDDAPVGGDVSRRRQPPAAPPRARGRASIPAFTLLDREDAADLLDRLRHDRGCRAPTAGSRARAPASPSTPAPSTRSNRCARRLEARFPWCLEWEEQLRGLFAAYVEAKTARAVLDYDDLLLYWFHLMGDAPFARRIGALSTTCSSTSTRTRTRCRPRSCAACAPTAAA